MKKFVQRDYCGNIISEIMRRPYLRKGAVPTIFSNLNASSIIEEKEHKLPSSSSINALEEELYPRVSNEIVVSISDTDLMKISSKDDSEMLVDEKYVNDEFTHDKDSLILIINSNDGHFIEHNYALNNFSKTVDNACFVFIQQDYDYNHVEFSIKKMMPHFVVLTPIRRRLIILSILLIICAILNLLSPSDLHEETVLQNSIAELQAKLEHLHAKYITSQEEINLLSHQLLQLIENNHILPDLQFLLNNATSNVTNIKLPSIYNFLPHFLNDPNSLRPAFVQSKGRTGVSMVLGVPTVKREVQSYLMATLKNLLDRMNSVETADTLIIVLIAETDLEYVTYVAKQIEVQFPTEFEAGVIDVISPSASYYPDLSKLHDTLGDDHQRVVWRSKQNLDFAFLMSYAQTKGTFYVQLEDDILVLIFE